MRVLVTGGTGVVGTAAVRSLLARGHEVRLLTRHAGEDAARWEGRVEPWTGSVAEASSLTGAAADCTAVLHAAGVVAEDPPEVTFDLVNVGGTHAMLAEAARAEARRFVYVSSLGAERGASRYHASKREAEALVRASPLDWLILRPGNVYGPGDEVISRLLGMVRGLPALPVVDAGDQPFQPLCDEDLGLALALAVERADLVRTAIDLAGVEVTTMQDLLDRLARLTGRDPARLPVPAPLATLATRLAGAVGLPTPTGEDQLVMLQEENVLPAGAPNALVETFGVVPIGLDDGLRRLAERLPPQLPPADAGGLVERRYVGERWRSPEGAPAVFERLRTRLVELLPEGSMAPVGATPPALEPGATLTLDLPLRGHVAVRVAEVADTRATLLTLAGHLLAGSVEVGVEEAGDGPRVAVVTRDRPETLLDAATMAAGGVVLKNRTWEEVVRRATAALGGPTEVAVERAEQELDGDERTRAVERMRELALAVARGDERRAEAEARERLERLAPPAA